MGPFILRGAVIAERYLTMLREEVWPVISTWNNIENIIFMLDGAPPHFAVVVGQWLNSHLPGRWIGRDLTPCDLFLWGWLKEQVFSTKPTTLEELDG